MISLPLVLIITAGLMLLIFAVIIAKAIHNLNRITKIQDELIDDYGERIRKLEKTLGEDR